MAVCDNRAHIWRISSARENIHEGKGKVVIKSKQRINNDG
jgi:hypothetical protein